MAKQTNRARQLLPNAAPGGTIGGEGSAIPFYVFQTERTDRTGLD